jgi:DNA-binding Lrp family transcriptional regulator
MTNSVALELKPIDERILDELLEGRDEGDPWGRNTPSNLADELDVSRQWVTQRLQMMESADYVRNIGGGVYEFVTDPREEDDG